MASKDANAKKLKKSLRLLSKRDKTSLKPMGEESKNIKSVSDKELADQSVSKNSTKGVREESDAKKAFNKQKEREVAAGHKLARNSKGVAANIGSSAVPTKAHKSNLAHVFTGVLIACALLAAAFLWPYLPFNRAQVALPTVTTPEKIADDFMLPDKEINTKDGALVIDDSDPLDNGAVSEEAVQMPEDDLVLTSPKDTTVPPVVVTTTKVDEVEQVDQGQQVATPRVNVTNSTGTTTSKTVGSWGLLNLNTETFDIDDEDDDVTKIYLKDVCKSVYKQNANAFDFCRETSKLKKSSSKSVGKERCDGGGSCRVGDTCLLWNSEEQDNGDLKSYTATYICE